MITQDIGEVNSVSNIDALSVFDIATEIVSFLEAQALLPLSLTSKNFLIAVKRHHGHSLESDVRYFCTSAELAVWAVDKMKCKLNSLCVQAAKYNKLDVIQRLWTMVVEGMASFSITCVLLSYCSADQTHAGHFRLALLLVGYYTSGSTVGRDCRKYASFTLVK